MVFLLENPASLESATLIAKSHPSPRQPAPARASLGRHRSHPGGAAAEAAVNIATLLKCYQVGSLRKGACSILNCAERAKGVSHQG